MSTSGNTEDQTLLSALALAMVYQPRASLQELAKAAGISKATLYRFCKTREQLHEELSNHAIKAINDSIQSANLCHEEPRKALRQLIENAVVQSELTIFLVHYWKNNTVEHHMQENWQQELDAFFLRGQQQGAFRIDISAAALTELFAATLTGLLDAERRGRVAKAGLSALLESAFLQGILNKEKQQ